MTIKKLCYYIISIIACLFSRFSFSESDVDLANKIISSSQVVHEIKESVSPDNNVSFYVDGLTVKLTQKSVNNCDVINTSVIKLNDGSVISGTSSIPRTSVVLDKEGELLSVSLESPKNINRKIFDIISHVNELHIYNLDDENFSVHLEQFIYLTYFYISRSNIKELIFPKSGVLKEVGISTSDIFSISGLDNQMGLYKMIMDSNIKSGYDTIYNLENLECLSLALNEKIFNFGRLENLKKLDVYSPKFEDIKEIFNLKKLKNLSLWYLKDIRIQGVEFPQSIDNLSISASDNKAVPDVRGLKNLKALRFSNIINYHKLRIGYLPSLTKLNVKNSQLDELSGIGQFNNLEFLDIERNNVSDVYEISKLKNLKVFKARDNNIKDVTPLFELKNLERVELRKNKIETVVPMGVGSSIKYIDYSRNPVKNVDLESLVDYPYVSIILLDTPYLNNASQEEINKITNLRLKGHF
ncbi:hypothetical protein SAMN04488136_12137 [Vibrio xiamenensis]|uniref:Uncharacterized protein n=1 Tax=Vibrio xiamenensis TaxID=861298 RepID=A0A1G8DS24_9VIBR|nr:leucine-rich repeat domain-containing protein [Vibrio xiamenensis]SDH60473.1 hypothetical protein SAMN04488136_12137 [Vibrio xiamenensis]